MNSMIQAMIKVGYPADADLGERLRWLYNLGNYNAARRAAFALPYVGRRRWEDFLESLDIKEVYAPIPAHWSPKTSEVAPAGATQRLVEDREYD